MEEEEEQKKKKKKTKTRKKGCRTETRFICSRIMVIMIIQISCEIQGNTFQCFK